MESNFQKALPKFLSHEGGYVNHPSDPGGATNMGVTIANYRKYVKPGGTVADLKRITKAEVATVFKRHYWDKVKADDLPSGVDYCVADFAINSGPSRAAKYLQKAVGVAQDGVIGPQTMEAVRGANSRVVINRICDERLAFMKRIKGGSLWKTFGKGWSRRVADVRAVSLEWAATYDPANDVPNEPDKPWIDDPWSTQKPVEARKPVSVPKDAPNPPSASGGKSEAKSVNPLVAAAVAIFGAIAIWSAGLLDLIWETLKGVF